MLMMISKYQVFFQSLKCLFLDRHALRDTREHRVGGHADIVEQVLGLIEARAVRHADLLPRLDDLIEVVRRYAEQIVQEALDGQLFRYVLVDEHGQLVVAHLVHAVVQVQQTR